MSDYEFLKKTLKQDYSEDFMQPIFDLIDKDTPMKVIKKGRNLHCPKCDRNVGYRDKITGYRDGLDPANYIDEYCFNCGQKLGDE